MSVLLPTSALASPLLPCASNFVCSFPQLRSLDNFLVGSVPHHTVNNVVDVLADQ